LPHTFRRGGDWGRNKKEVDDRQELRGGFSDSRSESFRAVVFFKQNTHVNMPFCL
jgi:hypothetical protein